MHDEEADCEVCDVGTRSDKGQRFCSLCPSGWKSIIETSQTICSQCLSGRYTNVSGMNVCQQCQVGKAQQIKGQQYCLPCIPGTYENEIGSIDCKACSRGQHQDLIGKITCLNCMVGQYTNDVGAVNCLLCNPGDYQNQLGALTCNRCAKGQFTATAGSAECFKCVVGTKTLDIGSSTCLGCDPGTRGVVNQKESCIACETGLFQNLKGQTACQKCDLGKISNNESTACERPDYKMPSDCKLNLEYLDNTDGDKANWECISCPIGADCKDYSTVSNLRNFKGYWRIPEAWNDNPQHLPQYSKCPYEGSCINNGTINCTAGNVGPVCAICAPDHFRTSVGRCTPCSQAAAKTVETLAPPIVLILIIVLIMVIKRKKIRELRKKYANVWRDITRILTINISFAQVNGSLGTVIPAKWPSVYLEFLKLFKWTDFDLFSLFSFGCGFDGFDYRIRVLFACMVPIAIVILIGLAYICRHRSKSTDPATRTSAILYLFDLVDADKSESIDVDEFQQLLEQTGQPKTTEENALVLMKKLGGKPEVVIGGSILVLHREELLLAATKNKIDQVLGNEWVEKTEHSRAGSHYSANLLLILFMLHAPISQRLFHYFACDTIGAGLNQKSFLRQDYSLECGVGLHQDFVAFVSVFLFVFTGLFPFVILLVLCKERKKLYSPKIQRSVGFLYSGFRKGAEMWEIQEVFRKLILMGVLIFLPPNTRAAAAIFICVISCCLINFFQPHRNRVVLAVAQMSFLLSTFKYVIAVLMGPGKFKSIL